LEFRRVLFRSHPSGASRSCLSGLLAHALHGTHPGVREADRRGEGNSSPRHAILRRSGLQLRSIPGAGQEGAGGDDRWLTDSSTCSRFVMSSWCGPQMILITTAFSGSRTLALLISAAKG